MSARRRELFQTIRSEGALLPAELLQRAAERDKELGGLRDEDYHLPPSEPLNEAIVRSWNRLVGAWASFRDARSAFAEDDPGTTVTRERWLLVLFDELSYGRLQTARAVSIEGKEYPISHAWESVPIHLVGANVPLDRRTARVAGAAGQSPHSLVQELLNRSEERLWGFVSNGLVLRVLRDNSSLTRQAYLEFDVEQMMEDEAYSDFVVLWLVCHVSRVEGEKPHDIWLERWSEEAAKQGTRALDNLRVGVERAIEALGSGFLAQRKNETLREALRSGELAAQDYYRELLRLVYRLLFLLAAEDRGLLHDPGADERARRIYEGHYSLRRLRRIAERRRGTQHADLYESLKLVMRALADEDGLPALGLPPLGSFLWSARAMSHLDEAVLPNAALLKAIRELCFVEERRALRAVDYKNLGAEELGSVYESLLELHPALNADTATFSLDTAPGHERQTSGSYYTPTGLIELLLDSTLEPVIDAAARSEAPEEALLALKVCDPACGSGHFLVAAAHRIAKRLAAVRTGDAEPAPEATRSALREVVSRCVYGVDANPMAAELCKVSLWMEALEPGRPLSFLDSHVRLGNSLLGATQELITAGLPDAAFAPLTGDDRATAAELKKQNRREREGQLTLEDLAADLVEQLTIEATSLEETSDASIEALADKERRFRDLLASQAYSHAKLVADSWCAAFAIPKTPGAPRITDGFVRRLASGAETGSQGTVETIRSLSGEYEFFHWQIEFADVFAKGGFDAVIGNPPWGRVKLQDKRFFAGVAPEIAEAANKAARDRMIAALEQENPELLASYGTEARRYEFLSHFFHESGRYPLTGVGDVNTYALFSEHGQSILGADGRAGLVVEVGIATDDTTKLFFADLVDQRSLVAIYGFENEDLLFPAITNKVKFCVLAAAAPGSGPEEFELSFFNRQPTTARDPDRLFRLSRADVHAINPNTHTCPVFRSARDAEILRAVHRRFPILIADGPPEENAWGLRLQSMFHMANDSGHFLTAQELEAGGWMREGEVFVHGDTRNLPLLEGKMVHLWNPRHGTYEGQTQKQANKGVLPPSSAARLSDPDFVNRPKYWVEASLVESEWSGELDWALCWRDMGPLERTFIAAIIPRVAVGHTLQLAHLSPDRAAWGPLILATWSSLMADYAIRLRSGKGRMSYFVVKQLPMPKPETFEEPAPWANDTSFSQWLTPRALELMYTAWEMEPFARDAGCELPPFRWIPERRLILEAELDGAFFHIYGLGREQVEHVLDSFRLLGENEVKSCGEFRTKRLVLERYDAMAGAMKAGKQYTTPLSPPPADPGLTHPEAQAA